MNASAKLLFSPNDEKEWVIRGWLLLGLSALALAGLYAVLLVMARIPATAEYIPFEDFFETALVIHVNLSVLIWLLSFTAAMITAYKPGKLAIGDFIALMAGLAGAIMLAGSPFMEAEGTPYLNNYVPVYDNYSFWLGLSLFLVAVFLVAFYVLKDHCVEWMRDKPQHYDGVLVSMWVIAVTYLAAIAAFIWSVQALKPYLILYPIGKQEQFEIMFWGGGHLLQFTYAFMMTLCWIWLANLSGNTLKISNKILITLYIINLTLVLAFPYAYTAYEITSQEHMQWFTQQMRYAGALLPFVVGLYLVRGWWRSRSAINRSVEKQALYWSILLFAAGGIISLFISGSNTIIPAHYHGSIVGVSLAFMGITYTVIDRYGYATAGWMKKLRYVQPGFYGLGQLMHIIALAVMGGYGAMRKTPGVVPSAEVEAATHMLRLGGMIAVLGGVFFIICAGWPLLKGRKNPLTD